MTWTRFMDMHSGGGCKEPPYEKILIEAPEEEAKVIFFNRFGHNPERVTCTCCGDDYSISSDEDIAQLTAFDRGCRYGYFDADGNEVPENKARVSGKGLINGCIGRYTEEQDPRSFSFNPFKTLEQYLKGENVLVVRSSDIDDAHRVGSVPAQGYVWAGD